MEAKLERMLDRVERLADRIEAALPGVLVEPDWSESVAFRYRRRAGRQPVLEPVRRLAPMRFDDLRAIDDQKVRMQTNIERFVCGSPANNVLLTGARGTGKSSLVKASLQEYSGRGLRLIEVDKDDLVDLPDIAELVAGRPERFIVFCDDLSFDEGERGYKVLKSMLDGTVASGGENVLIVATSNRRHLLPEYMKENLSYTHTDDGEVHPGEVVEEKISLSERFGLWISFYPFSQEDYLRIVDQWLGALGLPDAELTSAHAPALVWALERGSRSGRVAQQFARHHAAMLGEGGPA
ncbi:ATP-binding protein [Hydrogenophaga sp. 5NK40-0174]|uniref:ATP-binding protein n=1 Tax=Hydrogenophaga sp. 5NK40-0174 TaxID=3127649 RepID=UPI0033411CE2